MTTADKAFEDARGTASYTIDLSKIPGVVPGRKLTNELLAKFRAKGLQVEERMLGRERVYYIGDGYLNYYPKSGKLYVARRIVLGDRGYIPGIMEFEAEVLAPYMLQSQASRQNHGYLTPKALSTRANWNHPAADALRAQTFANVS